MKKKEMPALAKMSSKSKGKMSALNNLHKMASDMMGSDLAGLKKVSVMAPDKKGLAEGLDKAKQIVGGKNDDDLEDT